MLLFDERSGRIMNPSLAEYYVPVHMDVPDIEVMWTDEPDAHAPMGARGVGEISITGVGAAVSNAVFDATGKRVRDLPLSLDKVMWDKLGSELPTRWAVFRERPGY
jgi:xanthine dehydrogenase YagR molybdenum-binding subunit